jgi:hypothetical protein
MIGRRRGSGDRRVVRAALNVDSPSDEALAFNLALPVRPVVALVPVVFPLEWLEIREIIRTSLRHRFDMVYLPAPPFGFSIVRVMHGCAALVFPKGGATRFWRSLSPDSFDRCVVESAAITPSSW